MVSVGRAIETGGDNALAKLLQASQEMVSVRLCEGNKPSYFILKDNLAQPLLHTNVC